MAIMVAAARGRGLRLTADEVFDLSLDTGIRVAAAQGLTTDEVNTLRITDSDSGWARVSLYRVRMPETLWQYDPD